ncbi:MAG TPA: DMT family transporter [Anaerolineaceae bacterium]|nr:DMT family transporter [Anaerolineaceae bacterium]
MLTNILVVLIGLVGGAAVGIQSPIAGSLGQRVGGIASSFIVHVSGAIFSGILLFIIGGEKIRNWQSLPWYMLGAGIFGLILYQSINITFPRLGGAMMVTLIIVGQLAVGMLVDHFGWLGAQVHPISLTRIAGFVVLVVGAYLISR